MWKLFLLLCTIFFTGTIIAQNTVLKVEGNSPDLYISHTVAAKDNYYSVGRLYNFPPKELATYNKLQFEKGLTLGQVIKVPLNTANFSQNGELKSGEVAVPLYHTVQPKEGLYRISINYNKVPLEALRKWNKLSSDAVSTGNNIIVGYLKVLADQSALAKKGTKSEKADTEISTVLQPKKDVVVETKPVTESSSPVKPDMQPNDKPVAYTDNPAGKPAIDFKGGAFKKLFKDEEASIKESGSTGVFKSTSGWQDGKYYCLHNTARPETIIKVTNPVNGRSIYAKVLDMMPDLKQNNGSLILISNAAAEELGINDSKSDISLNYSSK